ncbi:MAG: ribonuclease H [Myxococcota bacterium]
MPTVAEVLARHHRGPDQGVFTDGSAQPNPGPGGWGVVFVQRGEIIEHRYGHEPHTTNNRMELVALIEGFQMVPAGISTTIYSDSELAVKTVNEWAAGWEKRGWKRKGGPIKNLDLVQELYAAAKARPDLELRWIRAHDGARWNEYADALATAYTRSEV